MSWSPVLMGCWGWGAGGGGPGELLGGGPGDPGDPAMLDLSDSCCKEILKIN